MPQPAPEMQVCAQGWHYRDVIILPELPVGELVDPFGAVIAEIANLESRNEKRGLELLILRRSGIGDSCRRGTASNRS
jgi:hypothetical protein